jgi:signal peptidase I
MSIVRRILGLGTNLALLTGLAIAAVMLLPAVFGYDRFVITTGSMTGTADAGSLVFSKPVDNDELRVGDVITYTPPPSSRRKGLVTHRIATIRRDRNRNRVFHTKGDANRTADHWTFVLGPGSTPRMEQQLPYVGYLYGELSRPELRRLVIGLPAVLIALFAVAGFVREARREARAEGLQEVTA